MRSEIQYYKMAANRLRLTSLKFLQKYNVCNGYAVRKSFYCTKKSGDEELAPEKKSGFAKFDKKQIDIFKEAEPSGEPTKPVSEEPADKNTEFSEHEQLFKGTEATGEPTKPEKKSGFAVFDKKQADILKGPETPPAEPPESFVTLLRNSNFIAMGDPIDKVVTGRIIHVVGKDLYIDFGWKFLTVCTAPEKNKELYVPGTSVKLLIKDLELATKFLGGKEEITLCEADCVLLGLAKRPSIEQSETVSKEMVSDAKS